MFSIWIVYSTRIFHPVYILEEQPWQVLFQGDNQKFWRGGEILVEMASINKRNISERTLLSLSEIQ